MQVVSVMLEALHILNVNGVSGDGLSAGVDIIVNVRSAPSLTLFSSIGDSVGSAANAETAAATIVNRNAMPNASPFINTNPQLFIIKLLFEFVSLK